MNMSQRIGRPLVHLPVPVTFNVSQLGSRSFEKSACLPHLNLAGSLTALVNRYENKN
jgi:hypothetical protein